MVLLNYIRLMYELIIIDDDNGGYNIITQWSIVSTMVINNICYIKLLAVGGKLFSLRIGGGIYYYCYLLGHCAV